jgi:hypothetical protein
MATSLKSKSRTDSGLTGISSQLVVYFIVCYVPEIDGNS